MLLSVVGTRPPHHAVREEAASPSRARDPSRRTLNGTTPGFTASIVPATGPLKRGATSPRPNACSSSLRRGSGFLSPAELGAVAPHRVQNDRQLAGQGDLGALHAAPLGHLHRPALQAREA